MTLHSDRFLNIETEQNNELSCVLSSSQSLKILLTKRALQKNYTSAMSGRKVQCMKPVCLEEGMKEGCGGLFGKVAAAPAVAKDCGEKGDFLTQNSGVVTGCNGSIRNSQL